MIRGVKALFIVVMLAAHGGEPLGAQARPDFTGVWTDYVDPQQPAGGSGGVPGTALDLPFTAEARQKVETYRKLVATDRRHAGSLLPRTGDAQPCSSAVRPTRWKSFIGPSRSRSSTSCTTTCVVSILAAATCQRPIGCRVATATRAARWEGDTLVVETTKLVEQVDQRYPHSDRAQVVERYQLTRGARGRTCARHRHDDDRPDVLHAAGQRPEEVGGSAQRAPAAI